MKIEKKVFLCIALSMLAACRHNDSDPTSSNSGVTNKDVVLNIPDPVKPVNTDVTIAGAFEGGTSNSPPDIEPDPSPSIIYQDADTNSLTLAEIEKAPDFNLAEFAAAFDSVRAKQPSLSTSSVEFARAIITELQKKSAQANAKSQQASKIDIPFIGNLTMKEKYLTLRHPFKAWDTNTAAQESVKATIALFHGGQYLTRADAFRHSYWNWLMSKCCSVEWATAFATAHESEVPNDDDKRMDLNNNMVGRRLFLSAPTALPTEAQSALLNYKLLWINQKQMNVTVGIDYLVYLKPDQSVTVFDNGPSYDDIYTVSIAGNTVGDTPAGGSKAFEFNQIPSGTHPLEIYCKLDGTKAGCGFEIKNKGASKLPDGNSDSSPLVIQQGGNYKTTIRFPTMQESREN